MLLCTQVSRIDTPSHRQPRYRMNFGTHIYTSEDAGRTHLLKPGEQHKDPLNRELPTFDGMGLRWEQHVITGQEYGDRIEIKLIPHDEQTWEGQEWPVYTYTSEASYGMIPTGSLKPYGKYTIYQRTVGQGGSSPWTAGQPRGSPASPV